MDLLLRQPLPYQSLSLIHQFLDKKNDSFLQKWQYLKPLFFITIFKSAHYFLLSIFNPPNSYWQLLLNDIVRFFNLPAKINFLLISEGFLLSGYCLYLNYFHSPNCFTIELFADIMNNEKQNRNSVFLLFSKSSQSQKSIAVKKHLKQFCFLLINSWQIFIVAIGKHLKLFLNLKFF
mgnify:CR=1 FL=1